jgi:hypothetical protein
VLLLHTQKILKNDNTCVSLGSGFSFPSISNFAYKKYREYRIPATNKHGVVHACIYHLSPSATEDSTEKEHLYQTLVITYLALVRSLKFPVFPGRTIHPRNFMFDSIITLR